MRDSTRHRILSVARIVFAHKGAINTTMEAVARAAGLGRRTIYTYFKTREELLDEVIKREKESIIRQLSQVATMKISPEKKIIRFMTAHMKAIENLIRENHLLRLEFLRGSERIEIYRKEVDAHEKECLASILMEGAHGGVFLIEDFENTALLTITTLKGLENQFILDDFGEACQARLELWHKILLRGIKASA